MTALANPALLWTGLGLVSVPILIHFFFRRRHRVVRWAAMEFLLAALRKQKRRIEVENLVLLLLRCAAILLLALAVARPAVQAAGPFGGGPRAVVCVLDTSTSMDAQYTARSSLERARERAGRLLMDLPDASKVTLVVTRDDGNGGGPRALLENASPAEVRLRLAGTRLSYGPNDLGAVFRLVGNKLADLSGRKLVVFATDLQRRDWFGTGEPGDKAAARRSQNVFTALRGLRRGDPDETEAPPVVVLDVGGEGPANVVISEFTVEKDRQALAGELLGLNVRLINYGSTATKGTLSVYIARRADGQWEKRWAESLEIQPSVGLTAKEIQRPPMVRLAADSEGPVRFKAVFRPASGAADRLALDSERYLALRVRPPVRILPVSTVLDALSILRDIETLKMIDLLDPIYPTEFKSRDLSQVDVVLWADAEIHDFDEAAALKLEDFVRKGGGLLAYLGFYAQAGRVNRLFFKDKGAGLFPMLLDEEQEMFKDEEHPRLIALQPDEVQAHPLFKETLNPYFRSPDIIAYRRIAAGYPESSVVARYDAGDPAVLDHKLGTGRVIVVTTTPDERGFRLNGSLLPAILFFNAAHCLVFDDPRQRNATVGETFQIHLPRETREVMIEPPEQASGISQEPVDDASQPFVLPSTAYPGFYRVTARGVAATGASAVSVEKVFDLAANLDPREGDLRRVPAPELKRAYHGANLHFTANVEAVLPRAAAGGESDLSRMLLGCVFFVLFLELALAWHFGSRRRAVA
ncbi:MAG: BatA domain-containing protein [Planctomycetota bacterium]|jgi:hypothetical protein